VFEFEVEFGGTFGFFEHDVPLFEERERSDSLGKLIIFPLKSLDFLLKFINRFLHLLEMIVLPHM
jgi:hypothetical protein